MEGEIEALRAVLGRSHPTKLDPEQLALLQSPTGHGFGNELRTLERVGTPIKRMYGVEFGQTQVWRNLGKLDFCARKPERRAIERVTKGGAPGEAAYLACAQKSPSRRPIDRLHRQNWYQRVPDIGAYLDTQGANASHPVSFNCNNVSVIAGFSRRNYLCWPQDGSVRKEQAVKFLKVNASSNR